MSFPLAEWIDAHPDVPHHLAHSGMVGELRTLERALGTLPDPDPAALRSGLARLHGVRSRRIFLTHGATEGNSLALLYLARAIARQKGRAPRLFAPRVEYPPIPDTAETVGFWRVGTSRAADVLACSAPRNPAGTRLLPAEAEAWRGDGRPLLVDETFREFSTDPPWTRVRVANLWLTGSFTKVYGADRLRVGYVIPPEGETDAFGRLHGLLLDQLPIRSVAGALAVLAARDGILAESRAIFRRNAEALRRAIPDVPPLAAPVYFDRGDGGLDGDRLSQRLLRSGILVCPGSYFGDRSGVRICLTRRTFPADLVAYLRIRDRFVEISPEFGRRRRKRAGRA